MSRANESQLFVSFVTHGRNDDYLGNSRWRLEMCLNSLALACEELGELENVEVLVTDWGSEVPLSQVLRLLPAARRITRLVYVPPQLAARLQKDSDYPVTLAMNATIRRARGLFILRMDQDAFFLPLDLTRLFDVLRGTSPQLNLDPCRAMFTTIRRHIPLKVVQHEPGLDAYRCKVRRYGRLMVYPPLGKPYHHGAVLDVMHRDIWHETRGYDESMLYMAYMDVDLNARVSLRYPLVDLSGFGIYSYHSEHEVPRDSQVRRENTFCLRQCVAVNGEDWGLAAYELPTQCAALTISQDERSGRALPDWYALYALCDLLLRSAYTISFVQRSFGRQFIYLVKQPASRWPYILARAVIRRCRISWRDE